jgi:hypothetical protein
MPLEIRSLSPGRSSLELEVPLDTLDTSLVYKVEGGLLVGYLDVAHLIRIN